MAPAQQRLEAAHRSVLQVDERLVEQLELPGASAPGADRVPAGGAPASARPSRPGTSDRCRGRRPSRGRGRGRRIFSSWSGSTPSCGANGDADAGADHDMMAGNLEWRVEQFDQPLGECGRIDRSVDRSLDDGEFIAAEPRHGIGLARTLPAAAADGLQQRIADRMAERVVDRLELIEIEAQQRQAAGPAGCGRSPVRASRGTARGSAGRSAHRGAPDERSWLRSAAFGDVLIGGQPAASIGWCVTVKARPSASSQIAAARALCGLSSSPAPARLLHVVCGDVAGGDDTLRHVVIASCLRRARRRHAEHLAESAIDHEQPPASSNISRPCTMLFRAVSKRPLRMQVRAVCSRSRASEAGTSLPPAPLRPLALSLPPPASHSRAGGGRRARRSRR